MIDLSTSMVSCIDRIRTILSRARGNALRAANAAMVAADWHIGREIVEEEQRGAARAEYGSRLIHRLSSQLSEEFGKGFAERNLRDIRRFYLAFADRTPIGHAVSSELLSSRPVASDQDAKIRNAPSAESRSDPSQTLSPDLTWTHYRTLMRVVFFVARQKRITIDGDHFYIELVFYHRALRCFLLVDLKVDRLTQRDVGQMLLYTGYYEQVEMREDENPPIGLILCTDKNEAVVRYTLSKTASQIFASRYQLHLPSEEELATELQHERRLLEQQRLEDG